MCVVCKFLVVELYNLGTSFILQNVNEGTLYRTVVTMAVVAIVMSIVEWRKNTKQYCNDGRCTCEIKSRIATAKAAFNKKKTLFTSTLDLKSRKKLVKCYIWSMALYGAETWTLRAADQKTPGKFWNVVLEKDGEDQVDRLC